MKWAIFQENINSPNGQKKKKKKVETLNKLINSHEKNQSERFLLQRGYRQKEFPEGTVLSLHGTDYSHPKHTVEENRNKWEALILQNQHNSISEREKESTRKDNYGLVPYELRCRNPTFF